MAVGPWRKPKEDDYIELRKALGWLINFDAPDMIKAAIKKREKDPMSLEGMYWTGKVDGLDALRDKLIEVWNEHVLADKIEDDD